MKEKNCGTCGFFMSGYCIVKNCPYKKKEEK